METDTIPQSVSVFSNHFIETFSPEKLSNIQETVYGGGMNIARYGAISGGILVALVCVLMVMYLNREVVIQTLKQNVLWYYLGKPNEIHAVEIPENSKVNQLYDNFDILNFIQAV